MVTTHETRIRPTTRRSMASIPRAMPTPNTAPTRVCVVEIGMPVPDAITIVVAAASSAAKATARRQLGDLLADCRDHVPAECRQTNYDTAATDNQYPQRNRRFGRDCAGLRDRDDGSQRADRVGHVIGTVCERHAAGGNNHQHTKYAFDGIEMLVFLGLSRPVESFWMAKAPTTAIATAMPIASK